MNTHLKEGLGAVAGRADAEEREATASRQAAGEVSADAPRGSEPRAGERPADAQPSAWTRMDGAATKGLALLVAYCALRNVVAAAGRPFWYDEFCTWAVAHRPSLSALWSALRQGSDGNPPGFYVVERAALHLAGNEQIALRLPSMVAFCCTLVCVFVLVRKRSGALAGLACSAILLLTSFFDASGAYEGVANAYAIDARPYSLVAACIALALVCYQRAPRWRWMVLMGASLAAAEAFHYLSVFAFVPFGIAEAVMLVKERRPCWGVWLALIVGCVPLAIFWPLLEKLRQSYGSDFWSQPSLLGTLKMYGRFIDTSSEVGIGVAAILGLGMLALLLLPEWLPAGAGAGVEREVPVQEAVVTLGFLALPVIGFVGAKVGHGGMNTRYVLTCVLGMALALGYILPRLGRRTIAVFILFIGCSVGYKEAMFWNSHPGKFQSPTTGIESLVNAAGHAELPVVIASSYTYVPFAYYASPAERERFAVLLDHQKAIEYVENDTIEFQTDILKSYLPLRTYSLEEFGAQHPRFLLYAHAADWWPMEIAKQGYSVQVVTGELRDKVYLVDLKQRLN